MKPTHAQRVFECLVAHYQEKKEILTLKKVGDRLGLDSWSVSRAFESLVKRGYILKGYKMGNYVLTRERWNG